jgi:hypothetical protein
MLRSLSRAIVISALFAASAGAQFSGGDHSPSDLFDRYAREPGRLQHPATVDNGLIRIRDHHAGADVVVVSPEPASMALVATGLLGVMGVARRRRNNR